MRSVFILNHCYENEDGYDEIKFIGVYSTEEKAKGAIERLKTIEGFRDHPVDCFYIDKYEIDKDHWTNGFVKVCYP